MSALTPPWRAWRSRRAADLAQAARIAAARADHDTAWRDLTWGACSPDGRSVVHAGRAEADMRIERTATVLSRAQGIASPRAQRQATMLYTWGALTPPLSVRRQGEILAARKAARDRRGDVLDEVRAGRLTRSEGDALLAGWQPYAHPRDPLARDSRRRTR